MTQSLKTFKLEFLVSSARPLNVDILIDEQCYFNGSSSDIPMTVDVAYDETCATQHVFKLVVDGKRKLIDTFDDSDTVLEIKKLNFNNIDVLPMIKGKYIHDFNGFGEQTEEEFNTVVGCDGVLTFNFYTPVSYWVTKEYPY